MFYGGSYAGRIPDFKFEIRIAKSETNPKSEEEMIKTTAAQPGLKDEISLRLVRRQSGNKQTVARPAKQWKQVVEPMSGDRTTVRPGDLSDAPTTVFMVSVVRGGTLGDY